MIGALLWFMVAAFTGWEMHWYGLWRAGLPAAAVLAWLAWFCGGLVWLGVAAAKQKQRRAAALKADRAALAREVRAEMEREALAAQAEKRS